MVFYNCSRKTEHHGGKRFRSGTVKQSTVQYRWSAFIFQSIALVEVESYPKITRPELSMAVAGAVGAEAKICKFAWVKIDLSEDNNYFIDTSF